MSKLAYTVACPMNRVNGFQRCFYDISTHAHIIVHWLKKFTYKKPVSKRECVYLNARQSPKICSNRRYFTKTATFSNSKSQQSWYPCLAWDPKSSSKICSVSGCLSMECLFSESSKCFRRLYYIKFEFGVIQSLHLKRKSHSVTVKNSTKLLEQVFHSWKTCKNCDSPTLLYFRVWKFSNR